MSDLYSLLEGFWQRLPAPASAVGVLAVGWLMALAGRTLLPRALRLLRFERFSDRVGLTEFLRKGGARHSVVQLAGILAYWLVLAATFIRISRTLDIAVARELSEQLRIIVPSAVAALLIIAVGMVVVTFLANFATTLVRNAAIPNANLISTVIKCVGFGSVIATALDKVGFSRTILSPMFLMLFGAIVFGTALAFGLGCKDIARGAAERFLRELRERSEGARSTDLEG